MPTEETKGNKMKSWTENKVFGPDGDRYPLSAAGKAYF